MNVKTICKLFGLSLALAILALAAGSLRQVGVAQTEYRQLRIALPYDADTLDPHYATNQVSQLIARLIAPPVNAFIETWETPDKVTWILTLRRDVEFQDGTPLDAEAVKFNLEHVLNCKIPYSFLIAHIERVEALDKFTVRITTDVPFAPLMSHLAHIGMVSPKQLKEFEPCTNGHNNNPVGAGHFVLKEWQPEGHIVLSEVGGNYDVVFIIAPEDAVRALMLKRGEVHVAWPLSPEAQRMLEWRPTLELFDTDDFRTIYIGMNVTTKPFDDRRVRQAVNYCVDKEVIVREILQGRARISDAPIAPGVFGYYEVGPYPYDREKAMALLKEAGLEEGFKTTLYTTQGYYNKDLEIAEVVQAMLAQCKIEVEIHVWDWSAYLAFLHDPANQGEYGMYLYGRRTITGDADYGLYPVFHGSQKPPMGWNFSYYESEKVDALLDEARSEIDPEQRKVLYAEAQKTIWDDAPWLFLHNDLDLVGLNSEAEIGSKIDKQCLKGCLTRAGLRLGFFGTACLITSIVVAAATGGIGYAGVVACLSAFAGSAFTLAELADCLQGCIKKEGSMVAELSYLSASDNTTACLLNLTFFLNLESKFKNTKALSLKLPLKIPLSDEVR